MTQTHKNNFEKGEWYKDRDGDFIKFLKFSGRFVDFTAKVRNGIYRNGYGSWSENMIEMCIPMTIEEMKEHLPESEWWVKFNNDLFPIY
jgi:hypothetical protein